MYVLSFFQNSVSSYTSSVLGLLEAPYGVLVRTVYELYFDSSSYYLN